MANPLQQASTRRKFYYFGLIAVLFTVTIFWRGKIALPFLSESTILAQARELDMRELEQGEEADLTGNAISLSLTGSRGLAVSGLWWLAIEKQKRHEWNELELLVRSITKLQPHFITPWLFQSWNIAYNVSVESERLNDMYFYIARGIELLAEGERRNKNNPDLRWWIAFTYQNKFGVSDKVNTLRCLYQLSCIPPEDRDPTKLLGEGNKVNMREFQAFCEKNPQLVRRLRESPIRDKSPETLAETPADVVQFLKDNAKVPSRFKDGRERAAATAQFPVLPDPRNPDGSKRRLPGELHPDDDIPDLLADGFNASKAWYVYAQEPLPDPSDEPIAVPSVVPKGKRLPRKPALIIFRQGAPRAQSYLAERMQKEGWFDKEGWIVDKGRDPSDRWFETTAVLGTGYDWSAREWQVAFQMWKDHGNRNALELTPERYEAYRSVAQEFVDYLHANGRPEATIDTVGGDIRPEERSNPKLVAGSEARQKLITYTQNRQMTNFTFFLYSAQAEMDPQAIEARKLKFEADRARRQSDPEQAIRLYRQSFDLWTQILERYPRYRDLNRVEEDTYEGQIDYVATLNDWYGPQLREQIVGIMSSAFAGSTPQSGPLTLMVLPNNLERLGIDYRSKVPVNFSGPFDGLDRSGRPWIDPLTRTAVRERLGLDRAVAPPPP